MTDIFNYKILCQKCNSQMQKATYNKNGFEMRVLVCPNGHDKIIHPTDLEEYNKFKELKEKEFKVKMRIVGNSHIISIPKEIVEFMQDQEKIMNDMVKLCFEGSKKLTLNFREYKNE